MSKIEQLTGIPHKTVCHAVGILKEVLTVDLELLPAIQQQIGGEGIIVEIDESKFGKKRTIYGHPVHGVWVFGGVERTAERKMFLTPVDNRSAATLMPIIERYVQPGSIIYTDCWPAYRDQELHELGMEHFRVNHSQNFVDPNTGCHTQHIEGNWRGIKIAVPTRDERKELIKGSLLAFIWRRKFKDDLWWNLLRAVCSISFEHGVADEPQLIALGEAE